MHCILFKYILGILFKLYILFLIKSFENIKLFSISKYLICGILSGTSMVQSLFLKKKGNKSARCGKIVFGIISTHQYF